MRTLLLIVTAVTALAPVAAFAQGSGVIDRGLKVYATEKCAACHSVAGKGNPKGPLDGVGTKLTADEIRQWIVNAPEMTKKTKSERRPAMRAYANIQTDDLDALVAYLQSLKK
jgi:mono/diheme cytochrome c family protein